MRPGNAYIAIALTDTDSSSGIFSGSIPTPLVAHMNSWNVFAIRRTAMKHSRSRNLMKMEILIPQPSLGLIKVFRLPPKLKLTIIPPGRTIKVIGR